MASDQQIMIDALNRYSFRNIWNATLQEYRVNVKPLSVLAGRYLKGSVSVGSELVKLPDSEEQYIAYYTASQAFFNGLNFTKGSWVRSDEFLDKYKTLLYSYDVKGRVLPRDNVYLWLSPVSNKVIIAVRKQAALKIFGPNFGDFFLTVYRDSDQPKTITRRSWRVDPNNLAASTNGLTYFLSQSKQKNLAGTQVLINGVEVDHRQPVTYVGGDYVEILCDDNVVGAYDVNVSNNTTGYYSALDSKNKEILHCPKAINPENDLITHNTCTLTARTSEGRGLYVHRVDDVGVGQISHNDLSITTDVVDAYRTYFDDEDIYIHVRVRTHSKDNVLINELFYVSFLYICSDADILGHLRGEISGTLPFWRADSLESSFYTRMMFDTPNTTDAELLEEYVDGLGYYTVASILSNHVTKIKAGSVQRQYKVHKPISLIGKRCFPMVYLRGYKLATNRFTYNDNLREHVRVTLNSDVHLGPENDLFIALVEDGAGQPYVFTPIVGDTFITVPFADVSVFEEIETEQTVSGYRVSTENRYLPVQETPGSLVVTSNPDGTSTIVFGLSNYNRTFIIQNKNFCVEIIRDIDDMVFQEKGSLTFPLEITCSNDTEKVVPLLGLNIVEGYLNSLRLIEDLDMGVSELRDAEGQLAGYELSVNSLDYLKETAGNELQLVIHTGSRIANESGFMFNDKMSFDSNINLWYPEIGRAYVKGKLMFDVDDYGTYLEPTVDTQTGDAFKIEVHLLGSIRELLEGYSTTPDINRLNAIRAYFNSTVEVDKSLVVVERSHLLFSNYTAQVVKDLADGTLEVANDPDDVRFMIQFNDYRHLREIDTALKVENGVIDLAYVGVYGTYTNFDSVSPDIYAIIHRFLQLTLPGDSYSLGGI